MFNTLLCFLYVFYFVYSMVLYWFVYCFSFCIYLSLSYEGEPNENLKFFFIFYHGRYGVLIHDSYPDMRLFHLLLRGVFPSRWLQLLQWPLLLQLGVPDQVEESLLQN